MNFCGINDISKRERNNNMGVVEKANNRNRDNNLNSRKVATW